MSTTFRSDRAAEAIRMVVARVLTTEIADPRLSKVTITGCEVSRDLQNAKVFYTVLGDDIAREDAEQGFASAASFLRRRVGEEVPSRTVPEIIFRYDRSVDNAMRLDEILSNLPELKKDSEG